MVQRNCSLVLCTRVLPLNHSPTEQKEEQAQEEEIEVTPREENIRIKISKTTYLPTVTGSARPLIHIL